VPVPCQRVQVGVQSSPTESRERDVARLLGWRPGSVRFEAGRTQ